jgi:hypothetical protein
MAKFFQWLKGKGLWMGANGKPLSPATVKAAADAVVSQAYADIGVIVTRVSSGLITVADAEPLMQQAIRRGIIANAALAHGGYDNLTPDIKKRLEKQILEEHNYLRKRIIAVQKNVASAGQVAQRDANYLISYAHKFRSIYENERLQASVSVGHTEARRVLAAVNHCASCEEVAAQEWMPIDEMPPIGSDDCRHNCHCVLITRRGGGGQ